ncbi:MAG: hypothetical protein R3D59_17930 [Paracoccaceae bacterium]
MFGTLTKQADDLQKYKYHPQRRPGARQGRDLHAEADEGRQRPTGMHVSMSIWKDGKPLFAGDKYADLSRGSAGSSAGSWKRQDPQRLHQPVHQLLQRLIPGFEAPVLPAPTRPATARAACGSREDRNPKAKRVEARFPDPAANPYLAFSALLVAGLDGIKNKIDPGPASDKNLYDLPPEELEGIPTVCGSLREALENLEKDRLPARRRRLHQGSDPGLPRAGSGKRSTPTSTRRTRSSIRCIVLTGGSS